MLYQRIHFNHERGSMQGWVSGTGGGISVLSSGGACIAPSAVQKERMQPQDIFVVADIRSDCSLATDQGEALL